MDAKPSSSAEAAHPKRSHKRHSKHLHEHATESVSNDAPKSPLPTTASAAEAAQGPSTLPPGTSPSSPHHAYSSSVVQENVLTSAEATNQATPAAPAAVTQPQAQPLLYGSRTVLFPRPSKTAAAERRAAASPSGSSHRSGEAAASKSPSVCVSNASSPCRVVKSSADIPAQGRNSSAAKSRPRRFFLHQDAEQFRGDLAIHESPMYSVTHRHGWSYTGKAVVAATLLFLFASLFALVVIRMRWSTAPEALKLCASPACRTYSNDVLASINTSVDPCRSFTHFVCDGWERDNVFSVRQRQFAEVVPSLHDSAFTTDVPEKGQNETQMAAALYRSCDDVVRGRSDQLPLVKALLRSAKITWPEVPEEPGDLLHTLLYTSLRLGWDAVVTFAVVRSSLEDTIVVRPGASFLFVSDKAASFGSDAAKRIYFGELLRAFRGDRRNATTRKVSYDDTIRIEGFALGKLARVHSVRNRNGAMSGAQDIVDAPEAGLSEARWMATLSQFGFNVSGGLNVATNSPNYLAALYSNRRLIFNYYDKDNHKARIYGDAFCVSRAMIVSNAALFAAYIAQVRDCDVMADAREATLSVRSAFRDRLEAWPQYDGNVTVVSDWNSLDLPFRSFASTEGGASARGPLVDMDVKSLVTNWVRLTAALSGTPAWEAASEHYAVYKLRYHVISRREGDFQLMPYALAFPLCDGNLPAAIIYGSLGAVVGRALGGLFVNAYGHDGSPASAAVVADARSCLLGGQFVAADNVHDVLAEAFGIGALVAAYKLVGGAGRSVEGMETYSGMQLLFIAMCYNKCLGSMDGNKDHVCNALLQYVPEFADAFRCPPGAPMNPLRRCKFL
ncbi:hypothetical protein HPB50_011412 [Hyalomma asiaticum]|uniref:Uncharacterized protein n=1 Tax=Hyalomma asiaticum TaxID=266040 RepID=A0ACB7TDE2_HYAAI|nr:hypothetical protein HPB50_011412 [Hyalomma asiaticum]